jgi:hypothetical protein
MTQYKVGDEVLVRAKLTGDSMYADAMIAERRKRIGG